MENSRQPVSFLGLLIVAALLAVGCTHGPAQHMESPDALLNYACRPGSTVQTVKGTVWMKAQSKDASGQFPASVEAKAPDHLQVEAINLLGAVQAVITVDGKSYSVQVPTKNGLKQREQGLNSWSGIPLQWATDLFLGRIPCPTSAKQDIEVTRDGDLKISTGASSASEDPETFIYHFRSVDGHPWPETLIGSEKARLLTKSILNSIILRRKRRARRTGKQSRLKGKSKSVGVIAR